MCTGHSFNLRLDVSGELGNEVGGVASSYNCVYNMHQVIVCFILVL